MVLYSNNFELLYFESLCAILMCNVPFTLARTAWVNKIALEEENY